MKPQLKSEEKNGRDQKTLLLTLLTASLYAPDMELTLVRSQMCSPGVSTKLNK
jgi:hypothetical protein